MAGIALAGLLVGCSVTQASEFSGERGDEPVPPAPLSLTLTPNDDATDVAPRDPITVVAENGTLTEVSLVGTHGTDVDGALSDDNATWTVGEPLGYGRTYTLTATGVGEDGEERTQSSTFTTATPVQQVSLQTNVFDGATVGVGMPVSFWFSAPIADKDAAEQALRITTTPETTGGFYWFNDSWVVWRPESYWEPGTEVQIDAEIYGADLGNGMFGVEDVSRSMTIGDKVIVVADGETHQMTVEVNGEQVKQMPISMGKPATPTPQGIYTVMSEHQPYTLDSSTYGVPDDSPGGYKITVDHATRLSNSGIFYHSAPWSLGQQGNTNVSHGCINLSTQNAGWMIENSKPGDIFEVANSGGVELDATDGWSFWQLSWNEWQTGGNR